MRPLLFFLLCSFAACAAQDFLELGRFPMAAFELAVCGDEVGVLATNEFYVYSTKGLGKVLGTNKSFQALAAVDIDNDTRCEFLLGLGYYESLDIPVEIFTPAGEVKLGRQTYRQRRSVGELWLLKGSEVSRLPLNCWVRDVKFADGWVYVSCGGDFTNYTKEWTKVKKEVCNVTETGMVCEVVEVWKWVYDTIEWKSGELLRVNLITSEKLVGCDQPLSGFEVLGDRLLFVCGSRFEARGLGRGTPHWTKQLDLKVRGILAYDFDSDGEKELAVLHEDGLSYYSPISGELEGKERVAGSVVVAQLMGKEVLLSYVGNVLRVPPLSHRFEGVGVIRSLALGDIDADKWPELFLTDGSHFYAYDIRPEFFLRLEAHDRYLEAKRLFEKGRYEEALVKLDEAETLFSRAGDESGLEVCLQLEREIRASFEEKLKRVAAEKQSGALLQLSAGNYDEAKKLAEEALAIYRELRDERGVKSCEELLKRIEKLRKEAEVEKEVASTTTAPTPTRERPALPLGTILLSVCAIAIALILLLMLLRR